MADNLVNLNKARKQRAKAQGAAAAAENRARFGQTKGEKTKARSLAGKLRQALDSAPPRPRSPGLSGLLRKRSLSLAGHATSLALEPEFWAVLEDMAGARGLSLAALLAEIDRERGRSLLASACRVRALAWARSSALPPGG